MSTASRGRCIHDLQRAHSKGIGLRRLDCKSMFLGKVLQLAADCLAFWYLRLGLQLGVVKDGHL